MEGNGRICCILQVCCPLPGGAMGGGIERVNEKAVGSLASVLFDEKSLGLSETQAQATAVYIFTHFDLVPPGLAQAIYNAYDPEFAKKYSSS